MIKVSSEHKQEVGLIVRGFGELDSFKESLKAVERLCLESYVTLGPYKDWQKASRGLVVWFAASKKEESIRYITGRFVG